MNFAVNEFGYLDQKNNDEDVNITCTRSRDSDSSIRSCSIILRHKNLEFILNFSSGINSQKFFRNKD